MAASDPSSSAPGLATVPLATVATSTSPPRPSPSSTSTSSSSTANTTATQGQITDARAAIVASIGNMVDAKLQERAAILHANAGALNKQEKDVEKATAALRKETDGLAREAVNAARKVKELGNVQNWAEVLWRDFLVIEETVRLANGEGESEGECGSQCTCGGGGSESGGDEGGSSRTDEDAVVVDVGARSTKGEQSLDIST